MLDVYFLKYTCKVRNFAREQDAFDKYSLTNHLPLPIKRYTRKNMTGNFICRHKDQSFIFNLQNRISS